MSSDRARRRRRALIAAMALAVFLVLGVAGSATMGPARIPFATSAGVLLESVGIQNGWGGGSSDTERQIVRAIRLPRIMTAALVGATLAIVGTVMQGLFRNPMADPGIVGVSAGASLGAVLVLGTGVAAGHWLVVPASAFVGALIASLAVFGLSLRQGRSQMATLLLSGVAVTYLCSAATSLVITLTYERDALREVLFWLLGGFDNRGWHHVQLLLVPTLVGSTIVLFHARTLNVLLLGEEEARSLGVRVGRVRVILLVAGSLMAGVAVAVSGLVGFVGLVVPHLVRLLVGPDHRLVLPLSALAGAWFMVAADTVARTLLPPTEIRVGIVTAIVGAPFFLFILRRQSSQLRSF